MALETTRKTTVISAKVTAAVAEIVRNAAVIRGWPTSRIVEEGALIRAQQVLEETTKAHAQLRRMTRQSKSRQGGLAQAAKNRHK